MIANNCSKTKEWINKINNKYKINENDLVIRMNHCNLGEIFDYRADIIILRTGGPTNLWGGIFNKENNRWEITIKNFEKFTNLKEIYIRECTANISEDLQKQYNNIKVKPLCTGNYMDDKNCNKLKTNPSLGYMAFCFLKYKYPNAKFYLLGFTYYDYEYNSHDRKTEMSLYKKYNIILEP